MKSTLRILGILILFVVLGIAIIIIAFRAEYKRTFPTDVAHFVIQIEEDIPGLESVEFNICERTYKYSIISLNDTISENLEISDERFPCPVNFIYHFNSFDTIIQADSFHSGGHSGANIYMLKKDSVLYKYSS